MSVNTILWCGNTMWWQQAELIALRTLMLISCLHIQSNLIFLHFREHGKPRSPSMYIENKVAICCLLSIKLHLTFLLQFCEEVFISSIQKCCPICHTKWLIILHSSFQCKRNCKDQNNLCIKPILEINCQYRHTVTRALRQGNSC